MWIFQHDGLALGQLCRRFLESNPRAVLLIKEPYLLKKIGISSMNISIIMFSLINMVIKLSQLYFLQIMTIIIGLGLIEDFYSMHGEIPEN